MPWTEHDESFLVTYEPSAVLLLIIISPTVEKIASIKSKINLEKYEYLSCQRLEPDGHVALQETYLAELCSYRIMVTFFNIKVL